MIAAIEAPLMNVRRAIIFSSRFVLTSMRLHHHVEVSSRMSAWRGEADLAK